MLRVALKPSARLACALSGAHLAAALSLLPLEVALGAKLALVAALAVSLAHCLWRHALLKGRTALVGIELRAKDTRVAVQTRDGAWHEARVLATTYVSAQLSVLNLRLRERALARHILILPDSADADEFRRLRVVLRWGYRNDA